MKDLNVKMSGVFDFEKTGLEIEILCQQYDSILKSKELEGNFWKYIS